jgi:CheY-like chemotaxis protein
MWVESELGRGSTFHFTAVFDRALPPRNAEQREPTLVPAPRRRLRVLVAEDNAVSRKVVSKLLQKRGHRVTAVENGRAALNAIDAAGKSAFDVVLMDLQMPQMGGFETTRAIRDHKSARVRRLPIIALTAHAMQGDRERCLDAGMDGYVSKPINVADLMAAVESFDSAGTAAVRQLNQLSASTRSSTLFDEELALAHAGGRRRLLKEMIALYRADAPSYKRRISSALRRKNGDTLRMAAHALKGALAMVGSDRGRHIASELEQVAASGQWERAEAQCLELGDCLTLLDRAFSAAGLLPAKKSPASRRSRNRTPAAKQGRR